MNRRTLLATAGSLALGGLAGCGDATDPGAGGASPTPTEQPAATAGEPEPAGPDAPDHPGTIEETLATNGDYPADGDPADGRPPSFSDPPPASDADESAFEAREVNGETVRLAPIDVVESWYLRGEARFVDARGLDAYTFAHVYGAVSSPARRNSTGGAVEGWPTDGRIVTYCGCPHHLSSIRAAGLKKAGVSRVYAIDEGFGAWADRANPMAGTDFRDGERAAVAEWTLAGRVDPRHAGEYAWATAGRQHEAAPIRADGSFSLAVSFPTATAETPVRVTTPDFEVRRPLSELAETRIDADLAGAGGVGELSSTADGLN